ncbi:MAG TPA: hypothetical protein VFK02_28965 [Kofleriaceae bacterium]|nr:hypothetical protein [Kofleriaceae bacterium]
MPALSLTAVNGGLVVSTVDAASDQITSVAHGLKTGDGPASPVNFSGALPGGLTTGADYFVIKVDADHFKLATSRANAADGIAVDLTSAGDGNNWLFVGLPVRRQTTYGEASQVFSRDLNAIQDGIAGAMRPPFRRNAPLNLTFVDTTNTWTQSGAGIRSTAVAGVTNVATYIDCPYDVGDRLLGVEVWRKADSTAGAKGSDLILATTDQIVCTMTDTIASGAARAMVSVTPNSGINHVMTAGERLRFAVFGRTSPGYIIDCVNLIMGRF